MALHSFDVMQLAIEVNPMTGGVAAVMVRAKRKLKELDACVADALAVACFGPDSERANQFFYVVGRNDAASERLAEPRQLTPVASKCPPPDAMPTPELPTREEIAQALKAVTPRIQRCMPVEYLDPPLTVALHVHGPTGRVAAAAAVVAAQSAALDACVAVAFAETCFFPFTPPPEAAPYWPQRYTIIAPERIKVPPP